jgi:peroxiredoxin (alkyl hydroperoxide reductase subunit C)
MKDGCVKPAAGPVMPTGPTENQTQQPTAEVAKMRAQVGKEAPDFEANAFITGVGFEQVKLSNYRGKWIVLCFYPGDFTFV